ncbi:MAG: ABC transporter ATP-binding protein [Betaproteobacteria bacterium]|nr:ABC transporter ATP-binding protein [Betaproteobacteria bacterium]
MLETENLSVAYGPIEAVKGLSLRLEEGQLITIVGANGAGKSTTIRALSGEIRPSGGEIRYRGRAISRMAPHEIARLGIVQCPEGRRVFAGLSVLENLKLGAYGRGLQGEMKQGLDRVFGMFPRLAERREQLAGTLSGGEQQMLAIGRALMARPEVLLLDEPSLGLAPIMVQTVFEAIREINRAGTAVLLVEQNAFLALRTASYGYVLQTGRVVLEGTAKDLAMDEQMMRAYLG